MTDSNFTTFDQQCMTRALELAQLGQGRVEPNPMVGAVLARDNTILAEGYHAQFGGPHAEAFAIEQARQKSIDLNDVTCYVTLEPCCHTGKTPPCTQALIKAGVSRVVSAMRDPFEKVAGQGIAELVQAGVQVDLGLYEREARQLNLPFLKRLATGKPWVIAKWAQTLDGYIASRTGDSKWISSETSRQQVHELRARVDAVIVGIGTVFADNPSLNAREVEVKRPASAVIIDPQLALAERIAQTSAGSQEPLKLLERARLGNRVIVACHEQTARTEADRVKTLEDASFQVLPIKSAPEMPRTQSEGTGNSLRQPATLDIAHLLAMLGQQIQASNVLVEGGRAVHAAFFQQQQVDELRIFIAPRLLGDREAISSVECGCIAQICDALPLKLVDLSQSQEDIVACYQPPGSFAQIIKL